MNLRNLAVWGVIVTIMIALYSVMTPGGGGGGGDKLDYSKLVEMVDAGQIREAEFRGDTVFVQDAAGKRHTAVVPIPYTTLVERMEASNVDFRIARQGNGGFLALLINFLPILLLIGVWVFFMRQMQGGTRGAMGFGKSKAKLLTENKNRVTFEDVAAWTRPRRSCRRSSTS
jgi:cell division protease FtsH